VQLNDTPGALRLGLMAAACTLLAQPLRAQSADDEPLKIDAGLLYYHEDQGRIRSYDAIVNLSQDFGDQHVLGVRGAFDSLSGGSPNGALPSRAAQTFATPSGTSLHATSGAPVTYTTASGRTVAQLEKVTLYTVAAGALPLDPDFHDTRVAGDLSWAQPLGIENHLSLGAHLSHEYDFLSASGNAALSRDFNAKNTTLGLGFSAEFDNVKPVGGVPLGGSDYTLLQKSGTRTKQVYGAQLGLTQVLARNWITQLKVSVDRSQGYLTDPYKLLTVVDATGAVAGYRFEQRPEVRTRKSLYWGNKLALGRTVLDLSYRHGMDDWGIRTDTAEARYRFNLAESIFYLEPHLRYYKQSAADFYHLYVDTGTAPGFASADPRLAAFTAKTIGLKLGVLLDDDQELNFSLEGYMQDAAQRHSALPGLTGLDLNPALKSVMFQVNWHFNY
jgi:hypothetical protein